MKQIKKGVWQSTDDADVFGHMAMLKKMGVGFPENFGKEKCGQCIPYVFVGSNDGVSHHFCIYLFLYADKENDNGYVCYLLEDFLTINPLNILDFAKIANFNSSDLCAIIFKQTQGLAAKINYGYNISMVINDKFIGLMATIEHPIDEMTNIAGHNN